jgi:23S rRNA pseudouridine2605 synthase
MSTNKRRPPVLDKKPRPESQDSIEGIRLNRFIAQSGLCSRRKADELITAGVVRVNGSVVTELGTKLSAGDEVVVNGHAITPLGLNYILLNKPTDAITTTSDERNRRTVLDVLTISDEEKKGLFPVGRLDRNTTGALILTNDGDLANRLMHPRYEVRKLYVAGLDRPMSPSTLETLRAGVVLEDGPAKPEYAAFVDGDAKRVLLQIHEGRNRQVRRMIEALGLEVKTLERIQYAGLDCKGLRPGKWRILTKKEVAMLRREVGLKGQS